MGSSAELNGRNLELLKELHLLTRDGHLNQDARRKLKQIDHLLRFIEPLLAQAQSPVTLVDHGAGKSYLGFLLWDAWFSKHGGIVIGVEQRQELVARSRELANRLGFKGMQFVEGRVGEVKLGAQVSAKVDLVTALHACDTATDDAISFGLETGAQHIVIIPCCQAEVASGLRNSKAFALKRGALAQLWRHPLHTREFGAQITNVLRCLRLEASGYKVTVTELVGWEHSLKNELIIASRNADVGRRQALERLNQLLEEIGLGSLHARFAPRPIS